MCCQLVVEFSVGIRVFVIGMSQISFSCLLKVELLQTCFVIECFESNRTDIGIGHARRLLVMEVRGDFILDGPLIQNVAMIQSVNAFTGKFDIQKRSGSLFL